MAPRTVLYLHSSAQRYGSDRQLHLVATGLDPARYRPLVVLPGEGPLAADLREAGVDVRARPLAVLRRALLSPAGLLGVARAAGADARALSRLGREREVALVHTNTSVTLGGAPAARALRVPHVWHVRESYAEWARWWPAHRRLLLTARAVPCISRAVLAQFGGHPRARLLRDALALDPEPLDRYDARGVLGLPPGAFVVAHVGRISSWKGQDVLARALADPALARAGAVGIVAGAPWPGQEHHAQELRALASELGLGDRLRLLGEREDVATVYAAADVVAVSSTQPEPLGQVALEGAAASRCVVAAAHGGLVEIVRDRETGRLVPPGDPAALAAALTELAADHAGRERLGRAARDDVRRRFEPRAMLARLQDLYDELAGGATK